MLDTCKVGSYISKLRKERDWTQMEMADKLNVSHQAVSKWERGDSLPDIGTLMTIGQTFGVSIDELMNGGSDEDSSLYIKNFGHVMKGFSESRHEEVSSMINTGEADMEGLVNAAPLLKSSELTKVTSKLDTRLLNPDLLVRLAPFIETELLDKLVVDRTVEDEFDIGFVQKMAPFLSKDVLRGLIEQANKDGMDLKAVSRLAPFIGREAVDELMEKAISDEVEMKTIVRLAPFCSREKLISIVDRTMDGQLDSHLLTSLAPFLGREYLNRLVEDRKIANVNPETITRLAPFVDKTTLSRWIQELLER